MVLSYPGLIINGQVQQPRHENRIPGSESPGMRVWVITPNKPLRPAKMPAKGKKVVVQVVESGLFAYQNLELKCSSRGCPSFH